MIRIPPSLSREKPLHWVASAKRDYLAFPTDVQDDVNLIGERLKRAQADYERSCNP